MKTKKSLNLKSKGIIAILFLLICYSSQAQYFWQVSSITSLNGPASTNVSTSVTFTLAMGQCAGGIMQPHNSTSYTRSVYINTINSTSGGTLVASTGLFTQHIFNPSETFNVTVPSTPGTYYYYAVLSNPSMTTCGFTNTLTSAASAIVVNANNNTQLIPSQCNSSLTVLDASVRLYCNKVTNATNYIWEFTDISTNTVAFTKARMAEWTDFYLTGYWPQIQYNKTYSVKVKAYVNGVWGAYGNACTITTPATPSASMATTKLTTVFCDQTLTSLNSTTKIYCDIVQGATDYEWQFSNSSGTVLFTKRRLAGYSDFYLKAYWTTIQTNRTYNVKVRAYLNGQWTAFGQVCTLTTPTAFGKDIYTDEQIARLLMGESEETIANENQLNLINIYPNPTKDVLNIESPIEVKNIIVTNLAGQKVAEYANTNSINISTLVNGIYFINVSTNEGSKNLKVIKD